MHTGGHYFCIRYDVGVCDSKPSSQLLPRILAYIHGPALQAWPSWFLPAGDPTSRVSALTSTALPSAVQKAWPEVRQGSRTQLVFFCVKDSR